MKNKELELEIAKKVQEIKELYYKEYPEGDYLAIAIYKDGYHFNNSKWNGGADEAFPIEYWKREETEDDLKEIFEGDEQ